MDDLLMANWMFKVTNYVAMHKIMKHQPNAQYDLIFTVMLTHSAT
jgi:hypothetical protein